MNNCPVCGAALESGRCNSCGYCKSADFLAHPTLLGDARAINEYYDRLNSVGKPERILKQAEEYLKKAVSALKLAFSARDENSELSLDGIKAQVQALEEFLAAQEMPAEESAAERLERAYNCYFGRGVARNYVEAFGLFESVANDIKASASDRAKANNMRGLCYELGCGTAKDYKKAFEHYKLASDGGNLTAKYNLGLCYYYGRGTAVDDSAAKKLFESVANDGSASASDCADANNMLGLCYEYGYGTAKDNKKAFEHYKLASDGGNLTAKNNLGLCYYYGIGTAVDYSAAKKLFEGVANDGYAYAKDRAKANNMLGLCYELGYGTAKDNKKAFEHYKLACDEGNLTAKYNLGLCYYYARGTTENKSTARKLFESVVKDESVSAQTRELAQKMLEKF